MSFNERPRDRRSEEDGELNFLLTEKAVEGAVYQYNLPVDEESVQAFAASAAIKLQQLLTEQEPFMSMMMGVQVKEKDWEFFRNTLTYAVDGAFFESEVPSPSILRHTVKEAFLYFPKPVVDELRGMLRRPDFLTIVFSQFDEEAVAHGFFSNKLESVTATSILPSIGGEYGIPHDLRPIELGSISPERLSQLLEMAVLPLRYRNELEKPDVLEVKIKDAFVLLFGDVSIEPGFIKERKVSGKLERMLEDAFTNAVLFAPSEYSNAPGTLSFQKNIDLTKKEASKFYRFNTNIDASKRYNKGSQRYHPRSVSNVAKVCEDNLSLGKKIAVVVPYGTFVEEQRNDSCVTLYISIDVHCVLSLDPQTGKLVTKLAEVPFQNVKVAVELEAGIRDTYSSLQERAEAVLQKMDLSLQMIR